MNRWLLAEGAPFPLGVSWIDDLQAYNFAVFSRHASEVSLLLYASADQKKPCLKLQLDHLQHKSGRIWHCLVQRAEVGEARYYAWAMDGPASTPAQPFHAFDPDKVLLDPYAVSVHFPKDFSREAAKQPGSNAGQAPLGVLMVDQPPFDWSGEQLPQHESDLIVYEMHVRGFTQRTNSGVPAERRGTFAGVIDKIPYLQQLGVTAVELMPIFQFDPDEHNYWGYMTLNFFSPHDRYTTTRSALERPNEFRAMVKALHAADIEVILDVVYNHTAEGNHDGPNYNYKGIDNSSYYLYSGDPDDPYANFSGTGNTLNCANRQVRRMILDSLRYWATEMHVDGFRFDLASAFSRRSDGSINLDDPPIFGEIRSDPQLGRLRLIAEPWDAAGAYQLGESFPGMRWLQWNGRFRDDVRRFVRGDPGLVSAMMFRLYGSDDLFPDDRSHAFHAFQSINYVNSHDGFTLYDQVAYNVRHNRANGHANQDGTAENFSWNCGHEGDRRVPAAVAALRVQQAKNFCCLLFLANGTPMFLAGDEFLHTQRGNNNPYNQDNETTWLDWDRLEQNQDFFRFFRMMIAFRKRHPTLSRSRFWRDDVRWYGSRRPVNMSRESQELAYFLSGASQADDDLYVMINMGTEEIPFTIAEGRRRDWRRVIDTACQSPDDFRDEGEEAAVKTDSYLVKPRSLAVLIRSAK